MVMAVRHLDTIATTVRRAQEVRKEMEKSETLSALLQLYGMTFSSGGRQHLVRALTMGRHTDCLLALVKHSTIDGKKDMKKSAIRGYASELLLLTVRCSDDMGWLRRYGAELLNLGRHDEHSKLAELVGWCAPLAELGVEEAFEETAVPGLTEVVRRHLQEPEQDSGASQGPGHDLVTAVRLLAGLVTDSPRQVVESHRHWQDTAVGVSDQETLPSRTVDNKNFKNSLSLKNFRHFVKRGG